MTAIDLPADIVWFDAGLGVAIVQGDKTAYEKCSRCGGHGMVDYGDSIGECSSCGGSGAQRAQGEHGRFTNHWLAPQEWARYDKPCEIHTRHSIRHQPAGRRCPHCESRDVWCVDKDHHFECMACGFGCPANCRGGRQVWTVRWPRVEGMAFNRPTDNCDECGGFCALYESLHGHVCRQCNGTGEREARATVQVVPVVGGSEGGEDGSDFIWRLYDEAWLYLGYEDAVRLPLDSLPTPGQFAVIVKVVE